LHFYWDGVKIRDRETESVWSLSGQAVSGELQGSQLEPLVSVTHFGYSWAVFRLGRNLPRAKNE
ncbi:MAG: hypothetical protein SVR04_03130, partial [Spirochaetota bacterium]|nr:hypothetical protein [Spirochaetota bacterium]